MKTLAQKNYGKMKGNIKTKKVCKTKVKPILPVCQNLISLFNYLHVHLQYMHLCQVLTLLHS